MPGSGDAARCTGKLDRSTVAARIDRCSAHGGSLPAGGPSVNRNDGPHYRVVPADRAGSNTG